MKKIFLGLLLSFAFILASMDFNTASKQELMSIKGIGEKKAQAVIDYRKSNKINNLDDLKKIRGFGDKLVLKIKNSKEYNSK
ncbi:helix-hairpin-helix domain-containing protein [Malaciobacter marinus]|jgi:competence protein ComEA|uniref:Competence protein ComEA n=1 Tax=Malaciobacter marinus TaxID=505249 RepID=A0AB37A0S4_9BACT|nr:helix-hairpin-helix domain-containing protein [Malaciobacter marinus]PPK62639.1 competence protein ComEA [Malaciobacter marinus]